MMSPTGKNNLNVAGNAGMTLIELCLACGLIAVIAAISWPALRRFAADARLETTARTLAATLTHARDTAIIQGRRYRLCFDRVKHTYGLSIESDPLENPGVYTAAGDSLVKERSFPDDIEIREISAREVNFEPDGTCEDFRLTLENLRGTGFTLSVIGRNGKCRIERE